MGLLFGLVWLLDLVTDLFVSGGCDELRGGERRAKAGITIRRLCNFVLASLDWRIAAERLGNDNWRLRVRLKSKEGSGGTGIRSWK